MSDIVTPENEALYREAFCVAKGHTMECVCETVTTMSKMMSAVCHNCGDIPVHKVIEDMEVEVFQHHLQKILDQKKCNCKQ